VTSRRLAANPLPYVIRPGTGGRTRENFEEAFADFAVIGYVAVKAEPLDDQPPEEYLDWIGRYGLQPSLSLFSSPFDETIDIAEEMERAKQFGSTQAHLGMDRAMVSSVWVEARKATPAVGAEFSKDRLALAIENCGIICQVLLSEGVRPLHHSHVGGVFETEEEIGALLDDLGPDVIGFGPDTGHLRWAGIDPAAFIRRYADRIGGIHVKDCYGDYLDGSSKAEGMSYRELQGTKRLWAEPGRGVIDFDAIVATLPSDYDGDFMIEIDEPSGDSRFESHKISFSWAQRNLPVAAG
jgi:inosose dehydratase